jgi:hypothetical protein
MIKRLFILFIPLLFPNPVFAHSFGKLYNLPVPFWMYLYGGAAALLVSFVVIGYFFNKASVNLEYPTYNLSKLKVFKIFTQRWYLKLFKGISVFLLLLTILTGIIGSPSPYENFNMAFFWIIFVLGLAYLTVFMGNIYSIINPWKVIVEAVEKSLNEKLSGVWKYPKDVFGYYPALLFYFLFIWIELFGNTGPFELSTLLIFYSVITFFGVVFIGKDNWFYYCDFFSVFFKMLGKMAPIEYLPVSSKNKSAKLQLRPPFIGLINPMADHISLLLFILFMLSSTAYDGFSEVIIWYRFYWQNFDSLLRPILGGNSVQTFQATALFLSPFIFLLIYLVLVYLSKEITRSKKSLAALSLEFAFSLIPIALVYNVAHYYTLILTEGQNFIRVISDPFGFGWDLFKTASYIPNLNVIDAGFTWHFQVALILIGHIVSVFLAHFIALKVFPGNKKALLSQFPMLLLMVTYTVIGLWILSQPVTGGTF